MPVEEYDFLNWTSFPSSLKVTNKLDSRAWFMQVPKIPYTPNTKVKFVLNVKQENVSAPPPGGHGVIGYVGYYPERKRWLTIFNIEFPIGTWDWRTLSAECIIPEDISEVRLDLGAGGSLTEKPALTWFDDLKIYQDDVLIYSDDFSNWNPLIGAGIGAPIGGVAGYLLKEPLGPMVSEAVGAVLGGALGGGVGLLTGLGIIPVPQIPIPTFGAAPEGPGAPARLGKYQITG